MSSGGAVGRVGVLGIGRMGLPVARAFVEAGLETSVFDLDPHRSALTGAAIAPSAAELAAASDILVTVLPGVPESAAAMPALIAAVPDGALWLDLTSNDPRLAESLATSAASRGIQCVGAPMGGGVTAAESGTLTFYAGGTTDAVARARPLLAALGTIDHVGQNVGDGYTAKLLINLLWFGQVVAVTEALLLGHARGIPPAVLRRSLGSSAASSAFIDEYLDRLLDGDYVESFGIDRCVEELEVVAALARDAGVPAELSVVVARQHRDALERFGAIDGELLAARLLEERAGRTIRR